MSECEQCHRRSADPRFKYCSRRCKNRAYRARRRKRGLAHWWFDFANHVERPIIVASLADLMGLHVDEVREHAERDVARGRLLAWRGATGEGPIREIGKPRHGRRG